MRAIDTNILVRLIARDDADQSGIADAILAAGDVVLLPTVLLEAEWVLRSRYALPRDAIASRLSAVCGQDNVTVVSAQAVAMALSAYADKGDFADLLHYALATEVGAAAFATFDQSFAAVGEEGPALEIR